MPITGFITPSRILRLRCWTLEMLTAATGSSAFESARALPAGAIRGFDISSKISGQCPSALARPAQRRLRMASRQRLHQAFKLIQNFGGDRNAGSPESTADQRNASESNYQSHLCDHQPIRTLIHMRPQLKKLALQIRRSFHISESISLWLNCNVN
jgi:hypothetical protein